MLFATMFCYLFYYTGRQNIGFVAKALQADLHLSATRIGVISAGLLVFYGVGQAINGRLGDRFGARRMMPLGATLSVIMNWATSFTHSFWGVMVPWSLNGYVQSMGWAPGGRLISNWWDDRERGRAFGYYVFAAGCSSVVTFALCLFTLERFGWRWVFRLPTLTMPAAGLVYFFVARDRPEDLGFGPISEPNDDSHSCANHSYFGLYRDLIGNAPFLLSCLAIGCESVARYGLIFWVPIHFLGEDWRQAPGTVWITLGLPVGMAFGALTTGYVSDRLFAANRSKPIAVFLGLGAVATTILYFIPATMWIVGTALLLVAGFLVFGPQSAFWALCPDLLGRSRAGTGVGIMDAFAYAAAAIGEVLIGAVIDASGQTGSAFLVVSTFCFLGAVLARFVGR